jgi:hypothetical protein
VSRVGKEAGRWSEERERERLMGSEEVTSSRKGEERKKK